MSTAASVPPSGGVSVAICGGGIAAASAADALAQSAHVSRVDIFEMGRGAGGRSASRRVQLEGLTQYFDHGLQYVSSRPGSDAFEEQQLSILAEWEDRKLLRKWADCRGSVVDVVQGEKSQENVFELREQKETSGSADASGQAAALSSDPHSFYDSKRPRYVPYPTSSTLVKGLLQGSTKICGIFGARGVPKWDAAKRKWTLHDFAEPTKLLHDQEKVDGYDFVIGADRLFLNIKGEEPDWSVDPLLQPLADILKAEINGIPSFTALLAVSAESSPSSPALESVGGLRFVNHPILGWASKQVPASGCNSTCWVVQSNRGWTLERLNQLEDEFRGSEGEDFDKFRTRCNEVADKEVGEAFVSVLKQLSGGDVNIKLRVGHRWGAAFPDPTPQLFTRLSDFQLFPRSAENDHSGPGGGLLPDNAGWFDSTLGLALCGDYFTEVPGRALSAAVSGRAAAKAILAKVDTTDGGASAARM
ncbi:unnamed protein product [Amoebophrya sp. A25]|nr:unnamed protein product [Amoebophrya sp. A25]|eukprot:GSA25T00011725001.1